ncbi:MAG: hypothetical protein AAF378_05565 [Cyanobacteria bacterium P01_A01_bin.84]
MNSMFYNSLILAQNQTVNDLTKGIKDSGFNTSNSIATEIDGLWNNIIGGGIYNTIATLGLFFAIGTLLIFIVQWTKEMLDGDSSKAFTDMIWPILVILLLSPQHTTGNTNNNGTILATHTRVLRGIINQTNQTLVSISNSNNQPEMILEKAYNQVMQKIGAESAVQGLMAQCNAFADPQQQSKCQTNAKTQAINIQNQAGVSFSLNNIEFLSHNPLQLAIINWFIALGITFQWIVEISLLLIGLLGPLAVGGSLLPVGSKAIFAWLIGFFSVGIVKLCFNVIAGLLAVIMLNPDVYDPLIFAFGTGLLAPILSVIIAFGGGFTVFNSLSGVSKQGFFKLLVHRF